MPVSCSTPLHRKPRETLSSPSFSATPWSASQQKQQRAARQQHHPSGFERQQRGRSPQPEHRDSYAGESASRGFIAVPCPFVDGDLVSNFLRGLYTCGRYVQDLHNMTGHNVNQTLRYAD